MSYVLLHEFDNDEMGGYDGRAVYHFWYDATEDRPFPDAYKVAEKLGIEVCRLDRLTLFHVDPAKVCSFKASEVGTENPLSAGYGDYVRPDSLEMSGWKGR